MMRYPITIKRGIEEIEWKAAIEEHWLMVPLGSVMRRPDLNIYTYLREYHFPRWRDVHGLARRTTPEAALADLTILRRHRWPSRMRRADPA